MESQDQEQVILAVGRFDRFVDWKEGDSARAGARHISGAEQLRGRRGAIVVDLGPWRETRLLILEAKRLGFAVVSDWPQPAG